MTYKTTARARCLRTPVLHGNAVERNALGNDGSDSSVEPFVGYSCQMVCYGGAVLLFPEPLPASE
eukprot:4635571-Pyramimonas_sp.AAC.1